ncbi:MAG: DUF4381 domain-containing protein [Pseudoruegeria sp.]
MSDAQTAPENAAPTSLADLIDQLQEVSEPPAISMFPQTVGWVVVAAIACAVLCWFAVRQYRMYQANAYRRAALFEMTFLTDNPAELATLLRRTALVAYGRPTVAGLQGADWVEFLKDSLGSASFDEQAARTLTAAPYRPTMASPDLMQFALHWVKHHKVGPN